MADKTIGPLTGVKLHLVESTADAANFMHWLNRPRSVLAIDTETEGLNPYVDKIRMCQFGDTREGWAIPWERWSGVALEALNTYQGQLAYHNQGFDSTFLHLHGSFKTPKNRSSCTMVMAHIVDPLGPGGLKALAKSKIDKRAQAGQGLLDDAFKEHGWNWKTVPINLPAYWAYGAIDPILTALLYESMIGQCGPGGPYERVFALEMAVRHICSEMERNGSPVDVEYSARKQIELEEYAKAVKDWGMREHGISMGSNVQLAHRFEKLGATIDELTATGQPKVDKYQLALLAAHPDPAVSVLADQALKMRKAGKLASNYFGHFVTDSIDGIIHPQIRTLGARTSRMCVPTSHRLLTKRGALAWDQVRPGDQTLGMDGTWTTIRAVHSYADAEIREWKSFRHVLAATAEHRWVTSTEHRPEHWRVQPLSSKRQNVLLAPQQYVHDFTAWTVNAITQNEVLAAIIGYLVSDWRCVDEGHGHGLQSMLYITEGKFYDEIMLLLPSEAITYDRITTGHHHEIWLQAAWLRPRLEAAGFILTPGLALRRNPHLLVWAMSLSDRESAAFLRAVFLSAGETAHPQHEISCNSPELREALQAAGYRAGYASRIHIQPPPKWGIKNRVSIRFHQARSSTRGMTESTYVDDAWCVSTDSGTCTMWSETGPYLTGNSISNPPLQQLPKSDATVRRAFIPRAGNTLLSSDFSQIEMRLMAHFSEDPQLIEAFREADRVGGDFFVGLGQEVYADPDFQKSDKRRTLIKSSLYGLAYGAGTAKIAETAGVPVSTMRVVVDRIHATYPGIKAFMSRVEDQAVRRERSEGQGYVITPFGRRLPCDPGKAYTLVNFILQGHAAEIFKEAIVRLDLAGYTPVCQLPVHDEVLFNLPKDDAAQAIREIPGLMADLKNYAVELTTEIEGPLANWGVRYE